MPKKKVDKATQTTDTLFPTDFEAHADYIIKCKIWNPDDLINSKCNDPHSIFHRFENQFFFDSTTLVNKRVFQLKKDYVKYAPHLGIASADIGIVLAAHALPAVAWPYCPHHGRREVLLLLLAILYCGCFT